jgi:hypothetical protein
MDISNLPPSLSPLAIVCGNPGIQLALSKMCISESVQMLLPGNCGVPTLSPQAIALVQQTLSAARIEIEGTDLRSETTKASLLLLSQVLDLDKERVLSSVSLESHEKEVLDQHLSRSKKTVSRTKSASKPKYRKTSQASSSSSVEPMDTLHHQEDGSYGFRNLKKKITTTFGIKNRWVKELEKIFGTKIFIDRLQPILSVPEQYPLSFTGQKSAPVNNTLHKFEEGCLLCNFVRSRFTEQIGKESYLDLAICHLHPRAVSIADLQGFRDFIKKLKNPE